MDDEGVVIYHLRRTFSRRHVLPEYVHCHNQEADPRRNKRQNKGRNKSSSSPSASVDIEREEEEMSHNLLPSQI